MYSSNQPLDETISVIHSIICKECMESNEGDYTFINMHDWIIHRQATKHHKVSHMVAVETEITEYLIKVV